MKSKLIFGFHAVTSRLRHEASSVEEIYVDAERTDRRMQDLLQAAKAANVRVIQADDTRLNNMVGTRRHQGVVAQAAPLSLARNLDELLDAIEGPPLLLVLDGITDPHNLGACLRVADGAGAHAVIAPRDKAVGLNATAVKVASGAADTVPYITVTNLARTLRDLKERDIWVIGTTDDADKSLYEADFAGGVALVMGSEGEGMRRLTRETCDILVSIPMAGAVESLNVSVASGVCLYEAKRQRGLFIFGFHRHYHVSPASRRHRQHHQARPGGTNRMGSADLLSRPASDRDSSGGALVLDAWHEVARAFHVAHRPRADRD
ncbi:MAG: rRNA methyltransferase [Burkholderiaceae bacterium]|nr:rRNA methyltransferase [Burkholderiaceae bacterium]